MEPLPAPLLNTQYSILTQSVDRRVEVLVHFTRKVYVDFTKNSQLRGHSRLKKQGLGLDGVRLSNI